MRNERDFRGFGRAKIGPIFSADKTPEIVLCSPTAWKRLLRRLNTQWNTVPKNDLRSYVNNLCSLKNFRLERDWNSWPLRYRCSTLPTELLWFSQLGLITLRVCNTTVHGEDIQVPYSKDHIFKLRRKDMKTRLIVAVIHNLRSCLKKIQAWTAFIFARVPHVLFPYARRSPRVPLVG